MKQKTMMRRRISKAELQRIGDRHRKAVRKWYKANKDYFKEYYYTHKEQIKLNYDNYRRSAKGQEAINRYESKPSRRKAKTQWMRDYRAKQKKEKERKKNAKKK